MRPLPLPRPATALTLLAVVLAVLGVVAGPSAAGAQGADDPVADAAESLRSDPVYVDPSAERALTDAEADDLREAIRDAGAPTFVAVLPASAGDADEVARRLPEEVGLSGTYAAVVGDGFRASSTELPNADELATAAFQAESVSGAAAVLDRFVDEVAAASTGGAPGQGPAVGDEPASDEDETSPLVPLAVVGAGGAGLLVWWRRRQRRQEAERRARLAADAQMIRAELDVVADDVLRLEPLVDLHPEARTDFEAAVERHRIASAALDYADEPVDLVRVARVAEEARYAMARARAIVDGREPPPPPEELRRPGRHQEPPVLVDEDGAPVYAGGQPFYGGGWFGGGTGGGLFSGLLLGSVLGGWGWGGWGWGGPVIINNEGDGGDGGDGGDWGGGDGGGGDWGGGDWGGGDLGGGDW